MAENSGPSTQNINITGGSGYGKTNSLFNLISHQADSHKNYLYPIETKLQFLID